MGLPAELVNAELRMRQEEAVFEHAQSAMADAEQGMDTAGALANTADQNRRTVLDSASSTPAAKAEAEALMRTAVDQFNAQEAAYKQTVQTYNEARLKYRNAEDCRRAAVDQLHDLHQLTPGFTAASLQLAASTPWIATVQPKIGGPTAISAQAQAHMVSGQLTVTPSSCYLNVETLVTDGSTIQVQIVRLADGLVWDAATNTFMAEASASNLGMYKSVPYTDPANPLRDEVQLTQIQITTAIFPDGAYRVYIYKTPAGTTTTALFNQRMFGVWGGVPYGEGQLPPNVFPAVADITSAIQALFPALATQIALRITDGVDCSKHKLPNTPGLAFAKILGIS